MGYGTINLDPSAVLNYTGATTLNQGQLTINADNQLPTSTDLVLAGVDKSQTFGNAPTLFVNNHTVTVNSLNSVNEKMYNNASNAAAINLGTTGVLKITGSGNSNFDGRITPTAANGTISWTAGTTSTIWMAGPGKLTLGLGSKAVDNHFLETFDNYAKLWVTNGGTVAVSGVQSFNLSSTALPPGAPSLAAVLPDAIKLDGGTLSFEGVGFPANTGGAIGGSTSAVPLSQPSTPTAVSPSVRAAERSTSPAPT